MDASSFRRYLWRLTLGFLVSLALATCLVFTVDPYGLYEKVDLPGVNRLKPYPARYLAEIKLARAQAQQVNALIMGNSRAEMGFDPEHAGFKEKGLRAYNLAVPGSDVQQQLAALNQLHQAGVQPRLALIGLDFMDVAGSTLRKAAAPAPLAAGWRWRFDTLFSLSSVLDAGKTIGIQNAAEPALILPNGLNPQLNFNAIARKDGYYVMFRQRAEENASQYLRWSQRLSPEGVRASHEFAALRELIRIGVERKIELDLVIYPYHAQLFALYQDSGVWPLFDDWKAAVAEEIAAATTRNPEARIALWDFSGFAGARCETIPARNDRKTATRWYWEGAHFKREAGDLMLDQILLGKANGEMSGTRLTPDGVAQNRQRVAAERAACQARYPELFAETHAMTEQARAKLQTASLNAR